MYDCLPMSASWLRCRVCVCEQAGKGGPWGRRRDSQDFQGAVPVNTMRERKEKKKKKRAEIRETRIKT